MKKVRPVLQFSIRVSCDDHVYFAEMSRSSNDDSSNDPFWNDVGKFYANAKGTTRKDAILRCAEQFAEELEERHLNFSEQKATEAVEAAIERVFDRETKPKNQA